jgi:hypothetical protein
LITAAASGERSEPSTESWVITAAGGDFDQEGLENRSPGANRPFSRVAQYFQWCAVITTDHP